MSTDNPEHDNPEHNPGVEGAEAQAEAADPWSAVLQLAELLNELATRIEDHEQRLGPRPAGVAVDNLEEWVAWLTGEYGLHGILGDRDRWANIPPVRNELAALRLASEVLTSAKPGSFEPVYWHDALARVLNRIPGHHSRWATKQSSLEAASRARLRATNEPVGVNR